MAVYKSIMSGGGRNLHFALVDDKTDKVETIDLKKWLKANVRDNSSKDSKERVIKAILKGQKQFNKKVDFNMWAKKTKPSFEQTMDYLMKNGFVSNITKRGIKVYEGVESVNEGKFKPSQVRSAISKVKKQLMRKWKQKGGYENFGQKELRQLQNKFDYNAYGDKDEREISHMLDGFDNWAMNYDGNMREGKKRFKRQDGIGKAKYTISYHDGKKKHKDGSDFFDIKIFKNKKDLSDFVGSLVKQGYKLTNESVNESKSEVEQIAKKTKSETAFYDVLSKIEKKYGKRNYRLWLEKSLKDLGVNPKHYDYRTNASAEEKLYQLTK